MNSVDKTSQIFFIILLIFSAFKIKTTQLYLPLPDINVLYLLLLVFTPLSLLLSRGFFSLKKHYAYLLVFSTYVLIISAYHAYISANFIVIQYAFLLFLLVISSYIFSIKKININLILKILHYSILLFLIASLIYSVSFGLSRMDAFFIAGTSTVAGWSGALLFFLSIYHLENKREIKSKKIIYFSILISLLSIIYAFSRSIFLGIISVYFLSAFNSIIRNKIKSKQHKNIAFLVLLTTTITLYFSIQNIVNQEKLEFLISKIFLEEEALSGSNNRLLHFEYAAAILGNDWFNWLFGVGMEDYRSSLNFSFFERNQTIHNAYLQYLVGTGFIGLILMLLYLYHLYKGINRLQKKPIKKFLKSTYIVSIILALFQPLTLSKYLFFLIPAFLSWSSNK